MNNHLKLKEICLLSLLMFFLIVGTSKAQQDCHIWTPEKMNFYEIENKGLSSTDLFNSMLTDIGEKFIRTKGDGLSDTEVDQLQDLLQSFAFTKASMHDHEFLSELVNIFYDKFKGNYHCTLRGKCIIQGNMFSKTMYDAPLREIREMIVESNLDMADMLQSKDGMKFEEKVAFEENLLSAAAQLINISEPEMAMPIAKRLNKYVGGEDPKHILETVRWLMDNGISFKNRPPAGIGDFADKYDKREVPFNVVYLAVQKYARSKEKKFPKRYLSADEDLPELIKEINAIMNKLSKGKFSVKLNKVVVIKDPVHIWDSFSGIRHYAKWGYGRFIPGSEDWLGSEYTYIIYDNMEEIGGPRYAGHGVILAGSSENEWKKPHIVAHEILHSLGAFHDFSLATLFLNDGCLPEVESKKQPRVFSVMSGLCTQCGIHNLDLTDYNKAIIGWE